jgi:hypothetical protein
MLNDFYTKAVLTIIAVSRWIIAVNRWIARRKSVNKRTDFLPVSLIPRALQFHICCVDLG